MLFDVACGVAERNAGASELAPLLRSSALFALPAKLLFDRIQTGDEERIIDWSTVRLPMPGPTWIETIPSDGYEWKVGMLLCSSETAADPTAPPFAIYDFQSVDPAEQPSRGVGITTMRAENGIAAHLISASILDRNYRWAADWMAERGDDEDLPLRIDRERLDRHVALAIRILFHSLRVLAEPTRFIVRVSQEKARPVQKGKIARSNQRARHILMPLHEIDRIVRQPNPENAGRHLETGHRRRGHTKVLRADRFKYKKGQLVRVKPCWVGPKEGRFNGERYEVLTDL